MGSPRRGLRWQIIVMFAAVWKPIDTETCETDISIHWACPKFIRVRLPSMSMPVPCAATHRHHGGVCRTTNKNSVVWICMMQVPYKMRYLIAPVFEAQWAQVHLLVEAVMDGFRLFFCFIVVLNRLSRLPVYSGVLCVSLLLLRRRLYLYFFVIFFRALSPFALSFHSAQPLCTPGVARVYVQVRETHANVCTAYRQTRSLSYSCRVH